MPSTNSLLFVLIAYLIGSFPSGLIIGQLFYKTDIRQHGSGSLGGTNALRVLGKKGGLIVYLLDILKGGIAVLIAMHMQSELHPLIISVFAPLGHVYPIFAKFKGGKAVATSAGIILFYAPFLLITLAFVFFPTLKLWKMVSLASCLTALTLSIIVWINPFGNEQYDIIARSLFTLLTFVVIVKHLPNFKRMIAGTENKIGHKK